jgi:hypothetical protein
MTCMQSKAQSGVCRDFLVESVRVAGKEGGAWAPGSGSVEQRAGLAPEKHRRAQRLSVAYGGCGDYSRDRLARLRDFSAWLT